jgi:hypothetical protein
MEIYRPLRLTLFIYDLIRLMVMISLLTVFIPLENSGESTVFPILFYAVPNGLFPLMTFFLWIQVVFYKPYIALYMAGKILAVVAVFSWIILGTPAISLAFTVDFQGTLTVIGTTLLLSVGDLLSVLGGAALRKRLSVTEPQGVPVSGSGEAPEYPMPVLNAAGSFPPKNSPEEGK